MPSEFFEFVFTSANFSIIMDFFVPVDVFFVYFNSETFKPQIRIFDLDL